MKARSITAIALALAVTLGAPSFIGCGHGEDEWQAELAKEKKLQSDLDAERAAHKSTQAELDKAKAEIEQLKKDMAAFEDIKQQLGTEKDKAAKLQKALDDAAAREKVLLAAKQRLEALKKKLDELKKFNLKVVVRHNQIVIEMPGDVLFPPGSELLSKEGKEVLLKVADVIRGDADLVKRSYQVVGHTDNSPYAGKFKDNVGLSLMRAREVYQFLTTQPDPNKKPPEEGGALPRANWSAAGFGELDPIAGNVDQQTPDEKKKNRRVEIAILPDASELMKLDVDNP